MNNLPLIFAGVLACFTTSWLGLVAYPYLKLGHLQTVVDEDTGGILPPPRSGLAVAGHKVYAANGCLYCHSQQVRQTDVTTSDMLRGWGSRPTVPRDYMRDKPVFLGTMRTGPDLTNIGARQPSEMWHHQHLYEPSVVMPGSIMPSYRYLYKMQKIEGQPSKDAITGLKGPYAPKPGWEVVPTEEAKALVAYLLSLNRNYPLPEAPEENLE